MPTRRTVDALMRLLLAAAPPALCLLVPAVLPAQVVTGRVVDEGSSEGIAQAIVEIRDREGREVGSGLADGEGRFRVEVAPPGGPFRLAAWAMSYDRTTVDSLHLAPGDTLDVGDLSIRPAPLALDRLDVAAEETSGLLPGRELVRRRQLLEKGTFLSGAVIDADDPYSLTEYLAEAAGLMVRWGFSGRPRLRSPRARSGCMNVTINHWGMGRSGYRSLDEIDPSWIAAVEIYETERDIPEEKLIGLDQRWSGCGLVNVWLWNSW